MLVPVVAVGRVAMTAMHVVDVVAVLDRDMPAAGAVKVGMGEMPVVLVGV